MFIARAIYNFNQKFKYHIWKQIKKKVVIKEIIFKEMVNNEHMSRRMYSNGPES